MPQVCDNPCSTDPFAPGTPSARARARIDSAENRRMPQQSFEDPGHPDSDIEITVLLDEVREGSVGARDRLLDRVYHELHALASGQMKGERSDNTLQATALVNEAYMRVLGGSEVDLENRRHLFGAFARAMREVLIDAARKRGAVKRGGGADRRRVAYEAAEAHIVVDDEVKVADVLSLDEALPKLEHADPRAAEVVRYRYFLGMKESQIAEILGVSEKTVQRDWKFARAFLRKQITRHDDAPPSGTPSSTGSDA